MSEIKEEAIKNVNVASLKESFIVAPFKSSTLSDLLLKTDEKQQLIQKMGLIDVYVLRASYDEFNAEWKGQLYVYLRSG